MQDNERLTLTIAEAAKLIGISRNSAYSLARQHKLGVKVLYFGRRMLVSKSGLMALLEDNGNKTEEIE